MEEHTTITVRRETHAKLKARKRGGESYNDLLTSLIEESDRTPAPGLDSIEDIIEA